MSMPSEPPAESPELSTTELPETGPVAPSSIQIPLVATLLIDPGPEIELFWMMTVVGAPPD